MADIIKREIIKGINLYHIPETKYKTVSMSAFLHRRLSKDEATMNALLAKLLKRGTVLCKNINELNVYADNLYGMLYDVNITKKAYVQSIVSSVNFLSGDYIEENIMEKSTEFMLDILFKPNTDKAGFPKDAFEVEKQNLKDDIEGLINDKRSYANFRCIEEMCKGEENAIFEFGYLEDLLKIDGETLYEHYCKIVNTSPVDIFVVGKADLEALCTCIKSYLGQFEFDIAEIKPQSITVPASDEVKYVEDVFDVSQGKLAMGFKTGIDIDSEDYYALLLGNSIFGSGAHSRLFNTVREKLSLCYYVSSMTDKFRALMLVSSGIEFENFEKAKTEIEKQLESIKNGDFTEEEFTVSKNYIINNYRSLKDSAYSMKDYYRGQCFCNNKDTVDEAIAKVEKLTDEDVVRALSAVKLDTVYFLKGKEA